MSGALGLDGAGVGVTAPPPNDPSAPYPVDAVA